MRNLLSDLLDSIPRKVGYTTIIKEIAKKYNATVVVENVTQSRMFKSEGIKTLIVSRAIPLISIDRTKPVLIEYEALRKISEEINEEIQRKEDLIKELEDKLLYIKQLLDE